MILGMYALKDELTGFKNVTIQDNDPVALRDFSLACKSTEVIKLNAHHFGLYKVGEYDTDNGTIKTDGYPLLIANADSLMMEAKK